MITTDTQESRINVTVLGEFTLADFKEFEEVVMKLESTVDLFVDLREMNGFTVDMALEEIRFARAHPNDFARIAVLTEDQWMTWSAWLSQLFVDAEIMVFSDEREARDWLAAEAESAS